MSVRAGRTSSCLDLETIAAYVDRTLPTTERAAAETHLAACTACYELLAEIAQINAVESASTLPVVQRRWPVRGVLAGLAAASIVLLAWVTWTVTRPPSVERQVAALLNGATVERFSRGRLAAADRWAPAPSSVRGGTRPQLSLEVQEEALSLQQHAVDTRSAASLRAAGIGMLALGRLDTSIQSLSEAAGLDPSDAGTHIDLSAALLDKALTSADASAAAQALEHAERALQLAPAHPAALFNRALAHEAIGNRVQAMTAWREYLALEQNHAWAEEARQRLAALEKASGTSSRTLDRARRFQHQHPAAPAPVSTAPVSTSTFQHQLSTLEHLSAPCSEP